MERFSTIEGASKGATEEIENGSDKEEEEIMLKKESESSEPDQNYIIGNNFPSELYCYLRFITMFIQANTFRYINYNIIIL